MAWSRTEVHSLRASQTGRYSRDHGSLSSMGKPTHTHKHLHLPRLAQNSVENRSLSSSNKVSTILTIPLFLVPDASLLKHTINQRYNALISSARRHFPYLSDAYQESPTIYIIAAMPSQTRSETRDNLSRGRYSGLYSGLTQDGTGALEEDTDRPVSPKAPRVKNPSPPKAGRPNAKAPSKRKAEDIEDGAPTESPSKKKRGRPSAEKETSGVNKKQKAEPKDDKDPSTWPICPMKKNNSRRDYRRGQVIELALPQPNLNPNISATDPDLFPTKLGGVYSKERMAVVLWRFSTRMIVPPMYSWGGRGITSQPKNTHVDYVEVWNEEERNRYVKEGVHDVLGVVMNKMPLTKFGALSLQGAVSVDYRENITILGCMSEPGHRNLRSIMNQRINAVGRDEAGAGF